MGQYEFHYWAFGLTIKSDIFFPEMLPIPAGSNPDVTIAVGNAPIFSVSPKGYSSANIQIDSSAYRLVIPDIATYLVLDGSSIFIQPEESGDWDSIRLFCLSNAFAALLQQRKLVPLHCAALVDRGELILLFGHSGAGKSTLFAALQQSGMKPFSDDVCVPVLCEDGEIGLYSSYPMMKFWATTLELLGWKERASRRVRPEFDKFGVYFHESFEVRVLKPSVIIILEKDQSIDKPDIRPLQGIEKFTRLEAHAYRAEFLPYADLKQEHFKLFVSLANQSRTFLLRRPETGNSLNALIDLVSKI